VSYFSRIMITSHKLGCGRLKLVMCGGLRVLRAMRLSACGLELARGLNCNLLEMATIGVLGS
jgi:hypothetical protein